MDINQATKKEDTLDKVLRFLFKIKKPLVSPEASRSPGYQSNLPQTAESLRFTDNGSAISDQPPIPRGAFGEGDKQTIIQPAREVNTIEDFERVATPIFNQYEIPLSVGFGQFGGEGRLGGLGAKR